MAADQFDWGSAKVSSPDGKPASTPSDDFDWSTAALAEPVRNVGVGQAIGRGVKAAAGNLAGGAALLAGGIPAQIGNLTGSKAAYSIGDYMFDKAKRASDYAASQQINPETEKAGPIARIAMGLTQAAPAVLMPELAVPALAIASKGSLLPEVANSDTATAQKLNALDTGLNTVMDAVPFSLGGKIARAAGGSRATQYAASAGTGAAFNVGADVVGRAATNAITGRDDPLLTPESATESGAIGALFGVHGTRRERATQAATAEAIKPTPEPEKAQEALPAPVITVGEGSLNPAADIEAQRRVMDADSDTQQLYAERAQEEQRRELAMNSQGIEVGELPAQHVTLAQGEERPTARGIEVGEPDSVTLRDDAITTDRAPTAEGIEVGITNPRIELLNTMLQQAKSPTARKILQGHIKTEQKRIADADTQTQNVAAGDELRGLADQALQAGDGDTHAALMKRADQLSPQASAVSPEAQAILTAAAQPNAGPLTRAVARGVTGDSNVLGNNQPADRGPLAAGGGEQRPEPQRAGSILASDGGELGGAQRPVTGEPVAGRAESAVVADASGQPAAALTPQPAGDWKAFPAETGSLGIPRAEMPQIKAENRGAMVNFLKGRGIAHEAVADVDPRTLKATQAEFSEAKVQQARDYKGGERSILVSKDGYVVDGHHQWVAALADNKPVQTIRLDSPVRDLVPALHEFPSSTTATGATARKGALDDVRIQQHSNYLSGMSERAGWAQIGGKIMRDGEGESQFDALHFAGQSGNVIGRTSWVPNAPWFKGVQRDAPLPNNTGGSATREAVRKAIAGEPMTAAEKRHVSAMLDDIEAEHRHAEQAGIEDYNPLAADVAASVHDVDPVHVALVEKATSINEGAVEAAATKFENDDAGFMSAIREIISKGNANGQSQEAGQSREGLQAAQRPDEASQRQGAEGELTSPRQPTDGLHLQEETSYSYGYDADASPIQQSNVASPGGKSSGGRSGPVPGQLDLFNANGTPRATVPEKRDGFWSSVKAVKTGSFRSGVERVTSPEEAAHVVAPLRREAQESVLALVTDKDGKPLSIIRNTIGQRAEAMVDVPVLLGAIHRVPGAAKVWFAHNHPSGEAQQSKADFKTTDHLTKALKDTGVESQGMIVVAPGGNASFYDGGANPKIQPTAAPRKFAVPVTGRMLRGNANGLADIRSETAARSFVAKMPEPSGLLLLDVQNKPVAWVPMDVSEMAKLRTGDSASGAGRIMQAMEKSNASNMILKMSSDEKGAITNMQKLANATNIQMLDAFVDGKSKALTGEVPVRGTDADFLSLKNNVLSRQGSSTYTVARIADLERSMTQRFGIGVANLQKRGVLNIVQSYSDLPRSVQQRIEEKLAPHSAGPEATPRAVYIGDEGKAYMIADLIGTREAPGILLHEVGEHYGLQKMLGDKAYARMLTEVRTAKDSATAVRDAWSTVKSNYGHLSEGSDEFVREVVAHVGETADAAKLGWFKTMLQSVRQFLFKSGFNMRLTDDDLRGMVSSSLRRAMRDTSAPEAGQPSDVNFSMAATLDAPATAERDGVWDKLQEKADYLNAQVLDSFSSLKKAQATKKISEADDAYAKEQLFHGRTETRLNSLRDGYVKPTAKLIANSGLTSEQVSKYLYALHAPERNAAIAKKNARFPDGGSGMTNAAAQKVMDSFTPEQRQTLSKVSDLVQKMNQQKLNTLHDAGLISPELHQTLSKQYKNYVPLKSIDDEEHLGIGQGLDIRGKETREAMGRSSEATDPLSVAIQDATRAVIRAEKNRVAQAFVRTALKHPDPLLWEPVNENTLPKRAVIGADGQVKYQTDHTAVYRDPSYFSAKFDGKDQFVQIKDVDLARQMKKLGQSGFGPGLLGDLMRGVSTVTRTLSMLYTQYNPDFAMANFVRDIQHSLITGTAQDVKGLSTSIAKAIPGSLKTSAKMAWADLRGHELSGADAKLYEQFKLDGATTGGYGLENVESIQKGLQRIIDGAEGKNTLANAANLGEKALAPIKAINEVFENATRFAAYKSAIDLGVSRQRAAVIAKNLTVNFNKRGESSPVFNALYAFFNASIQANATVFRAAKKSQYAQNAILGLMAAGAAEELMFNEEKDEQGNRVLDYATEFERDRNFVIPFGEERLKIPVAHGFNVPYMVGRRMARVAQGLETMPHAIAGIFSAAFDAFSPIHGGIAPTFAQPILDTQTNKSFSGGAIAKTPRDKNAPESYSNYPSANKFFVSLAQGLNDLTGGDRLHKGAVDISPEKTEYLVQQYLGGPFNFAKSISNLADPPTGNASVNDLPVIRRFVGEKRDSFDDQQARKIFSDAEQRAQSIKGGFATPAPEERRMIGSVQAQKSIVDRATARKNLILKANPNADTSTIDSAIQAANHRAQRIYNEWQSAQA